MGHKFGLSGLYTESYNKEVVEISDYSIGTQIQSRPNVYGKPIFI